MALSPKEVKVLSLVALGYSDKEIGINLKVSYPTVRTYIERIIYKLKARNRTNAVLIYKLTHKKWLEEYHETYRNSLDCGRLLSNSK